VMTVTVLGVCVVVAILRRYIATQMEISLAL
jgi:hypothetical protein